MYENSLRFERVKIGRERRGGGRGGERGTVDGFLFLSSLIMLTAWAKGEEEEMNKQGEERKW